MTDDIAVLKLKSQEDRRLRAGHLWIYSNEVDVQATPLKNFQPGQQVRVESAKGKVMGMAYINPHSLICARLFSREAKYRLDKSLLVHRLNMALSLREGITDQPYYRLVYGDSDFLPGLVVDRFGDVLVVQIATMGMEVVKEALIEALVQVLKPTGILMKNDSRIRSAENLPETVEVVYGEVAQQVPIIENGVHFSVPVYEGQKTGWFYDHRASRARLADYVKGKTVLDVFSYIDEFLRFALKPLAEHSKQQLDRWHQQFMTEAIAPLRLPQADALLHKHREQGDYLLIITATNLFVTGPIADSLGADCILATIPEFIDGAYTGKVDGTPCFQQGKVERLQHWLEETGHSLSGSYFYSDSHNDLPLLDIVDHPVAVDADDILKEYAQSKGWPVISLRG